MATEFTLFSQLIPELRLEIWERALPASIGKLLYPYKQGCWTYEDLGLELDPNGEDLYMKFDTALLDPLRISLPLHSVNHEARAVAKKYIQQQSLVFKSGIDFLRDFDPKSDTMFLPAAEIETFVMELINRKHEPDLLDRYISTSNPVLPRLAVTAAGLNALKGEPLGIIHESGGTIDMLYVVDDVCVGEIAHRELGKPYARLFWNSSSREWETHGDDKAVAQLKDLVTDLHDPEFTTSEHDLDILLVESSTAPELA